MKTSADARFLHIRWWYSLKTDVFTRVSSITYARMRIVYNKSYLVVEERDSYLMYIFRRVLQN